MPGASSSAQRIWTIGHSKHALDAFIELLRIHEIRFLADVRRYPGSRRNPHFGSAALSDALARHGIGYRHMPALGGRRRPRPDSENTGWKSDQFRAYADYMQTPEFAAALDELEAVAGESSTAIMCAEAVPWRCHRRLIADTLTARGWQVLDIFDQSPARLHVITPFAAVSDGKLTYPSPP